MNTDLRLLNDWQHGFPLCRDPFGVLAEATGKYLPIPAEMRASVLADFVEPPPGF